MEGAGSYDLVTERRFRFSPVETGDDTGSAPAVVGDRYELGELLGSGGTARVYRARDRDADGEFAIKLFHRNAATFGPRRARETAILRSLDHPGVVRLHDAGQEDDRAYLVMQLVEGEDLAERLLTGPLGLDEIVAMAQRLAEALAHVHDRGVVHRDLKPGNVLLGADGATITDFGVAYLLDTTRVTAVGAVAGTAAYMAPEQVLGEPVGPPADVYALGLVLIEAVTAEREYTGSRVEAALARLVRPPRIPEGLPEALSQLLHLMTARDPALRPTATEVAKALCGADPVPVASPFSTPSSSPPLTLPVVCAPAPFSPPPSRRRRGMVVAAVLSSVAAGVVLGALLTSGERGTDGSHPPSFAGPTSSPATSETAPATPGGIRPPAAPAAPPPSGTPVIPATTPPTSGERTTTPPGASAPQASVPPESTETPATTSAKHPGKGTRGHTPTPRSNSSKALPPGKNI
ncbi:serine/threonine-protein kinase [Amycolatopsis samaneae]|uniref:non-specific serine/threonine protein kinase n=1 Tax=Amycolatopsis samaneae TaxID=664691 RepID=A0ABW5GHC7_9PSEU